jgi:flagellar basal body P-ring formation protein FlgA
MRMLLFLVFVAPAAALADSVIATRTIRAQSVLVADDMTLVAAEIPGALNDPALALGQEARRTLYAGRPIRPSDLGPAAQVNRNQTVMLAFRTGGLDILTEGRALERGATGDVIRVMNIASRTTVSGLIGDDGTVRVAFTFEGTDG